MIVRFCSHGFILFKLLIASLILANQLNNIRYKKLLVTNKTCLIITTEPSITEKYQQQNTYRISGHHVQTRESVKKEGTKSTGNLPEQPELA